MSYPYTHKNFPTGIQVYIDPAILEIHEESPLAGETVETWVGNTSPDDAQQALVPVRTDADSPQEALWYVEEQYVLRHPEQAIGKGCYKAHGRLGFYYDVRSLGKLTVVLKRYGQRGLMRYMLADYDQAMLLIDAFVTRGELPAQEG